MNREIKFCGKRIDTGEWVCGNINRLNDGLFILENDQLGELQEPEYHSTGMGCGLEDRNITDRYEAMEHGWNKAIERQKELLPIFIEVYPETVGQYIGRKDKDGKEIYEGDIVDVEDGADGLITEMKAGRYKVTYSQLECSFILEQLDGKRGVTFDECMLLTTYGNIHDESN